MKQEFEEIFQSLKTDNEFLIPISDSVGRIGYLKPITFFDVENDILINNLVKWRNENIEAYLSHQEASFAGTRKWLLQSILDNNSRILFVLYSARNEPIGHMGLADGIDTDKYIEMDNIVRGVRSDRPDGLITFALFDLISWVFGVDDLDKVYLRVFSNNERAIRLYGKLRFKETRKYPLVKSTVDNVVEFQINESTSLTAVYFSCMELDRNDHFENSAVIKRKV